MSGLFSPVEALDFCAFHPRDVDNLNARLPLVNRLFKSVLACGLRASTATGETRPTVILTLVLSLLIPASLARARPQETSSPSQGANADCQYAGCPEARQGLDLLMNGYPDRAIVIFRAIAAKHPDSPLGYLLQADATWWKIYYTTAKLMDPAIFDVLYVNSSPLDSHFRDLVNMAIKKSVVEIRGGHDVARNQLYEGMAYALRSRFDSLRNDDLATARAGKKMRTLLLSSVQGDPRLTDAYAGIGIYNYFVDTLPGIIKLLRFLIALPGGNRALGLQQLEKAAREGDLTRGEAQFYLAKDYSRWNEKQYAKSLALFRDLARQYPHNPLWTLLIGTLEVRLGHQQEGETAYREVFAKTAGDQREVRKALHREAEQAIENLSSGN